MDQKIYIIVAADENMGIGKDGKMPWRLKEELKYFQDVTTKTKDPEKQNMVLMGRSTWESIPKEHRPLKGRKNVVLTRNAEYEAEGADVFHSLDEALSCVGDKIETVFVIGGAQVFKEAMQKGMVDGIYLTEIHEEFECDTFFPEIPENFGEPVNLGGAEEDDVSYNFLFYSK